MISEISPIMISQNYGQIININSQSGVETEEFCPIYNASKHGSYAYRKAIQRDLAKHNIKITDVCPGLIKTNFYIRANDKLLDELIHLPYYHEEDDFIMVHAGIQFDIRGNPVPLEQSSIENLVYDRRFKDEKFLPPNCKCIIFGHTPTCYIDGYKGKIKKYQKENTIGDKPKDYYKVHIDTGNYLTGILGCLRLDDMQEFYVSE